MNRKRYTQEFKQQMIRESQETGNAAQVARAHNISPNLLYTWIKKSKHREWKQAHPDAKKVLASAPTVEEYRELEQQVDKANRVISEQALEIEILRDLLKKRNPDWQIN